MSDISAAWKELRPQIGNLISRIDGENCHIDAKIKELQEKEERQVDSQAQIDEAYNKGIQDLYNAIYTLTMPSLRLYHLKVSSIPSSDMRKIFGTGYLDEIIVKNTPEEIIDKVNQWKAEKDKEEQELHVGDEIEYARSKSRFEKRIVIGIQDGMDDSEKIIWSIDVELSGHRFWFFSTDKDVEYRKTGKHYDAIPFPKNIK